MPHVIVKLWPGKSEEQKSQLAEEITQSAMRTLKYGEEPVSVAFEKCKPRTGLQRCTGPTSWKTTGSSTRDPAIRYELFRIREEQNEKSIGLHR